MLTAMLIAIAVGAGLVGYLKLSYTALKLSQRTFYSNCASNLAEAGLEQAIYCYRQLATGTSAATAWSGWTISGTTAKFTLPTFNCSQQAVGIVEVFVSGYDGSAATAAIYSQAVITPLNGSPAITETLKVALKGRGAYQAAIATSNSLSLGSNSTVDSFTSNPTSTSDGFNFRSYPGSGAGSAGNLVATAGTISLGSGALVKGSVYLGAGVTAPPQSQVTGTIYTNVTASYPTPSLPSWSSGTGYYPLTSVPSSLPRDSDRPAADGRYYYYPSVVQNPLVISDTSIGYGSDVTIFATQINGRLRINSNATCIVWCGNVTTSGSNGIENNSWSGALQIYSWGTALSFSQTFNTLAYIYAPLATVTFTGGSSSKQFTGAIIAKDFSCSGQWAIHYDTALATLTTNAGGAYAISKWYDLQGTAESKTLSTLTGGFLN